MFTFCVHRIIKEIQMKIKSRVFLNIRLQIFKVLRLNLRLHRFFSSFDINYISDLSIQDLNVNNTFCGREIFGNRIEFYGIYDLRSIRIQTEHIYSTLKEESLKFYGLLNE